MKTSIHLSRFFIWAAACALLYPGQAHANAGVPMIFLTWPGMVLALIPVILLEMKVIGERLGLRPRVAFKVSAWSNILTTFVGVPLTWAILTLLEGLTGGDRAYGIDTPAKKLLAITWQAPWLIPYEADKNLYWMVPAAGVGLALRLVFVRSIKIPTGWKTINLNIVLVPLENYDRPLFVPVPAACCTYKVCCEFIP